MSVEQNILTVEILGVPNVGGVERENDECHRMEY